MIIKNCVVTNSDTKVLKEYVVDKKSNLYREYKGYHSGVTLEAKDVYNAFGGKVMNVNKDNNKYSIIVQLDSDNCIKYSNLSNLNVKLGDVLNSGDLIGNCKKSVVVEYANRSESKFPVRIMKTTLYKQDPTDILSSGVSPVKRNPYDDIQLGTSYLDLYVDSDLLNGDITEEEYNESRVDYTPVSIEENIEYRLKEGLGLSEDI